MTSLAENYKWPLAITICMLIVFAANFWLVREAINSDKGLVDSNPYNESIKYQEVIDSKSYISQQGWKIAYKLQAGAMLTTITDASGNLISNLNITAKVIDPAKVFPDNQGPLTATTTGYISSYKIPRSGVWLIQLTIVTKERTLKLDWESATL